MTRQNVNFCICICVLICEKMLTNCKTVIGIDLGTAYTSVGIYRDGQVIIIPNEHGNKATPSCVAILSTGEVLIGEEALMQSVKNPKNTIYNVKRLIGRKWNDELVQKDIQLFPFKVFERKQKPFIRVIVGDKFEIVSPEEITALILEKMKEIAEEYIGEEITDAVITTPAYFNEDQRQATKNAGEIAGLNIKRILSEPTAAALSHSLFDINAEKNVLVYDLGGGTFDVSVVTCDYGVFRVLATVGNTNIGGEDFNRNVIDFLLQKIRERFRKLDLHASTHPHIVQKLREEVEFVKRKLSYEETVQIEIENVYENNNFRLIFSRSQFEELNKDLYETTLELVKKVLIYSKLDKSEIDEIVLVGGSSKMPKVESMLAYYFNGKKPCGSSNPEDSVVRGAAIEAGVLSNQEGSKHIVLIDVYPFSLGYEIDGENMDTVIPRNHVIPVQKTVTCTTVEDGQTQIELKIFRGDYIKTEKNILLGTLPLYDIPRAPKGAPIIEVTYEINNDGILNVTAREAATGNINEIVIDNVYNHLSFAERTHMLLRLRVRKRRHKQRNDYNKAKTYFENMIFMIKHCVDLTDKWMERNLNHDPNDFMYPARELLECVCMAKYGYRNEEIIEGYVMMFPTKREVIKIKYFLNYANKKMISWFNDNPEPSFELLIRHIKEIQKYTDFLLFGEYLNTKVKFVM